jgi:putative ABC transport system ATP-binding protein
MEYSDRYKQRHGMLNSTQTQEQEQTIQNSNQQTQRPTQPKQENIYNSHISNTSQQQTQQSQQPQTIIEAKNIHKTFILSKTNSEKVLKGINLKINRGEFVGLTGQSGSGKSTLLYILGLLDDTTQGEVLINGKNTYNLNSVEKTDIRLHQMGYIFQDYHLIPELNLIENLMIVEVALSGNKIQAEEKAKHVLIQVGLKDYLTKKPTELSGGQQQRVAIARAFFNNPTMLFADEPTANLDSKNSEDIMKLFKELNKTKNLTIVMVTHETSFDHFFDRIVNLTDGKII